MKQYQFKSTFYKMEVTEVLILEDEVQNRLMKKKLDV